MKRDIRDLFKEDDTAEKQLSANHRIEFLEKLKDETKPKQSLFLWLKIAAVLVVGLLIGFTMFNTETIEKPSPIIAQVEAVEAEYLKNIDAEWQSFIAVANDEKLVKRFERKLNDLDEDYKEIAFEFKENSNNILVVEALVDNLQTRLQILKDIQEHIKILNQDTNQKIEQNENTI
jgi:uncharacterized membrane-anchored protein YhcB (DUF1043 family)